MAGSHKLALRSGKRGIIYHKVHGNRRLRNLLERKRCRILLRTNRISHMKVLNTGYRYNISEGCLIHIHSL